MAELGPPKNLESLMNGSSSDYSHPLAPGSEQAANSRVRSDNDVLIQSSAGGASYDTVPDGLPAESGALWTGPPQALGRPISRGDQANSDDSVQPPLTRARRVRSPHGRPAWAYDSSIGPPRTFDWPRRNWHRASDGLHMSTIGVPYVTVPDRLPAGIHGPTSGPYEIPDSPTWGDNRPSATWRDLDVGESHTSGKTAMYSEYLREATEEDKQLEERWTETLNILLTFGGLLSAIITAFLLAVQPDLVPAPSDATNKILLQILQRLDNTTALPTSDEDTLPSPTTVRILAWWYASLACSLASTFGALLSKQWVLHYESCPSFADTLEKRCELREVRHEGLAKWHFNAIIGVLPVLLQIALLLFAIGLAEYLHPTPALFSITLTFISALTSFYIVTLLAGVFLPSCPFKTPVTHVMFRAAGIITAWCAAIYLLLITASACLPIPFGRERKPVTEVTKLTRDTLAYFTNGVMQARWKIEFGEQSLMGKDSPGSAGVLGAQVQRHIGEDRPKVEGLEVAAEAIMKMPVKVGANTFRQRSTFDLWSSQVVWQLGRPTPHPRSWLVEADLLFYVIYHFPESASAAKTGVLHDHELNIFTEKDTAGRLTMIIRQSWGGRNKSLPIATMRPTTVAAYLKFQLSHWCYQTPQERRDRDLIIQDLPDVLTNKRLRHTPSMHVAVIDAISLTAMIMVQDEAPGPLSWRNIPELAPLERLFQALDRLSYYPSNMSPSRFLPLAIESSYSIFFEDDIRKTCNAYPSWRNGTFARTLQRLLRLGRTWWNIEPAAWSDGAPGANLVHQVRRVLGLFANDSVGRKDPTPPGVSEYGIEELFESFAHPSAPSPTPPDVSLSALQLLDYAFGMRQMPHGRLGWPRPRKPHNLLLDHNPLAEHPEVLRQLLSTVQGLPEHAVSRQKKTLLSAMVRGRDIFFPKHLHQHDPQGMVQLSQDLDTLAKFMQRSGHTLWPLDAADPLITTRAWNALAPALKLTLSILSPQRQWQENTEDSPGSYTRIVPNGSVRKPSAYMLPSERQLNLPLPVAPPPSAQMLPSQRGPTLYTFPPPSAYMLHPNPHMVGTPLTAYESLPYILPSPPTHVSPTTQAEEVPNRRDNPPSQQLSATYHQPPPGYRPEIPAPNYTTLQVGIRAALRHIREDPEAPTLPLPTQNFYRGARTYPRGSR